MGRSITIGRPSAEEDPLYRALAPPPDETPEARAVRKRDEADAKKRSDEIDARIQAESAAKRKRGQPVKVLLLGQSESGKSTTLKNFQLSYAGKAWQVEKEAWRAVIQLNLVRSINAMAAAVARELDSSNSSSTPLELQLDLDLNTNTIMDIDTASILTVPLEPEGDHEEEEEEEAAPAAKKINLTSAHGTLVAKLAPLRAVQRSLEMKLGSGAEEFGDVDLDTAFPASVVVSSSKPAVSFRDITNEPEHTTTTTTTTTTTSKSSSSSASSILLRSRKSQEFFVRSNGWKSALQRLRTRTSRASRENGADVDSDTVAIARCVGDMKALWRDPLVRDVVRERKVKLLDCSDFFLDELERIANLRYSPSDDDVIRARLRTVGVQEHSLIFEAGPEPGREWLIYDVGGSRSLRAQWPAYFDDVHAIIFLAPINVFDERLAEDPRVNRLDDSMQLWKLVCENGLLKRTELVLFLNKCDLLDRKLRSGVRFGEWVRMYGEGENDAVAVGKFLRHKFTEVCRHYSKEHRGLHVHFTSVVDTKATSKTLAAGWDTAFEPPTPRLDINRVIVMVMTKDQQGS